MYLIFDMDDTMYDLMEPFQKAHETLFAGKIDADCFTLFCQSRIYSDLVLEQEKNGQIPPEDTFYQRIKMTYQDTGLHLTRKEGNLFEDEYRKNQMKIRLFDFMKKTLQYCKREQIPMAILTNGRGKAQRKKAEVLGLKEWFPDHRIFVSGEIHYQKPDVRAFQTLEHALQLCPAQTWYIGDTYESDIVGAAQAGWHTVWLNHRKRKCPAQVSVAEEELQNGEELLPLIRQKWRQDSHPVSVFRS